MSDHQNHDQNGFDHAAPHHSPASATNSVKMLYESMEASRKFKEEIVARYKTFTEQIKKLTDRMQASDTENRRLKSKVATLESENARLSQDNQKLLRNQQQLDAAIMMACNDFSETTQFISNATRTSMPSVHVLPTEKPEDAADHRAHAPSLSVVRKQVPTAMPVAAPAQAPAADARRETNPIGAPMPSLAALIRNDVPADMPAGEVSEDAIMAMTLEIERQIEASFASADIALDDQEQAAVA